MATKYEKQTGGAFAMLKQIMTAPGEIEFQEVETSWRARIPGIPINKINGIFCDGSKDLIDFREFPRNDFFNYPFCLQLEEGLCL